MKIIIFGLILITSILQTNIYGQELKDTAEKKHFLWSVQGNQNTVYLLGSIHFAKKNIYPLDDVIINAFENSQVLGVEVNSINNHKSMMKLMREYSTYQDDTTLKDVLPSKIFNDLTNAAKQLKLNYALLKKLKPWAAAMVLDAFSSFKLNIKPKFGIDYYFLNQAKKKKIKIVELESATMQVELLDNMPLEVQLSNLESTIDGLASKEAFYDQMIEWWKTGNTQALNELLKANMASIYEQFYQDILYKRNIAMVKKIEKYLKDTQNYFIIIGAGHFVGTNGIIKLLQNKGYNVIQM